MRYRCPAAAVLGASEISGFELLFRGKPGNAYATVEPSGNAAQRIPVLVWDILKEDENRLDSYEGYPQLYRKETMEVELSVEKTEAMVYLMNPGFELAEPSPSYLKTIQEGYVSAGFDPAILENALHRTIQQSTEENTGLHMR